MMLTIDAEKLNLKSLKMYTDQTLLVDDFQKLTVLKSKMDVLNRVESERFLGIKVDGHTK